MNPKKFFFAFIAAFIFLFGWFFHEVVLKDTYAQVPSSLMRTPDDFEGHFAWLVVGQLVFVLMFVLIFVKVSREVGWVRGFGWASCSPFWASVRT